MTWPSTLKDWPEPDDPDWSAKFFAQLDKVGAEYDSKKHVKWVDKIPEDAGQASTSSDTTDAYERANCRSEEEFVCSTESQTLAQRDHSGSNEDDDIHKIKEEQAEEASLTVEAQKSQVSSSSSPLKIRGRVPENTEKVKSDKIKLHYQDQAYQKKIQQKVSHS